MTVHPLPIFAGPPPTKTASAGSLVPSPWAAGVSYAHRDLARHLRVYGGPSLESRRDNAQWTAWLAACLGSIAMLYAELLAGWGWLTISEVMWVIAFIAGLIFIDAIRRRNKNERRIAEAEGAAMRAIAAALAEDGTRMGRAA